jgi:acetyl/propionyl-CoA carboxylase alpha subunit
VYFEKILIANRGEIACRIARTAHQLGIQTVGVYAQDDAACLHVKSVSKAVLLTKQSGINPYLDADQIIEIALREGAQAIHPGYGFLSERAFFAKAVNDAGLVFIGPSASVIELMGKKDAARAEAERSGVPVVPYFQGAQDSPNITAGDLPIMIKATAGGGGKGMRVVKEFDQLGESIAAAKREAKNSFGDETLLFEKYLPSARHIEVQVLFDQHGNGVHLFDRECSAQRRHQKVIEEAPAPKVPEEIRQLLFSTSLELCRNVAYSNAGTVEFIFDGKAAYFLEMNTRIQVEHCVTEMITGIDIVEQQLKVASGAPLGLTQDQIQSTGHSIEARVYAEDPANNFLPQSGKATYVRWPTNLRCESAIESKSPISANYDPMIGKIISHAQDRSLAIAQLVHGINQTAISGITHNLGFVNQILESEAFKTSSLATNELDNQIYSISPEHQQVASLIAGEVFRQTQNVAASSWRIGQNRTSSRFNLYTKTQSLPFQVGKDKSVTLQQARLDNFKFDQNQNLATARINNEEIVAILEVKPTRITVHLAGNSFNFYSFDQRIPSNDQGFDNGAITAQMPGTVTVIAVQEGQPVQRGDLLCILEAMKMESRIEAQADGTVLRLNVEIGQKVPTGFEMMQLDIQQQETL